MTAQLGYELRAADAGPLDECDLAHVRELITQHGWVRFKGFNASPSEFETFSDSLGACDPITQIEYKPGGMTLEHHAEDAYTPYRPDALWLLCVNPGELGGAATIVTDAVKTFADMSDEWQQFCRDHRLRFGRLWSSGAWEGPLGSDARPQIEATLDAIPDLTYEFLPDGALFVTYEVPIVTRTLTGEESFANSALHAANFPKWYGMSLADGSPVPDELLSHAREIVVRHEAAIDWDAGDFLVVENFRTMHRRPDYAGRGRVLLRRNCRDFFGTPQPDTTSPTGAWLKGLLNQELGDDPVYFPLRGGPLDESLRAGVAG